MTRRVFYDFEFLENGETIRPISIGMTDDEGTEYYAVFAQAPWKEIAQHEFLMREVVPLLPLLHGDARMQAPKKNYCAIDFNNPLVKSTDDIKLEVAHYLLNSRNPVDELWADYCAYDHVALAQLLGPRMIEMPEGVPWFTNDLQQLWRRAGKPEKPTQDPEREHNALDDARYDKELWHVCQQALDRE